MKKDNIQLLQEITERYKLERYPKDEFTQAIFKEFRKYGTKLLKIENYEDMQKRGIQLQQEMIDLVAKKTEFQSHLSSLQRALDIYASSHVPTTHDWLSEVAKVLVIAKISKEAEHLNINPLNHSLQHTIQVFEEMMTLKSGIETSIKEELKAMKDTLQKLCNENVVASRPEISTFFNNEDTLNIRFKLLDKCLIEPLTKPPGLDLEAKDIVTQALDEAEIPPDPSTALPVSVLVSSTTQESPKEESVNDAAIDVKNKEQHRHSYEIKRYSQRRGRRPRGRGFMYVKRSEQ